MIFAAVRNYRSLMDVKQNAQMTVAAQSTNVEILTRVISQSYVHVHTKCLTCKKLAHGFSGPVFCNGDKMDCMKCFWFRHIEPVESKPDCHKNYPEECEDYLPWTVYPNRETWYRENYPELIEALEDEALED